MTYVAIIVVLLLVLYFMLSRFQNKEIQTEFDWLEKRWEMAKSHYESGDRSFFMIGTMRNQQIDS